MKVIGQINEFVVIFTHCSSINVFKNKSSRYYIKKGIKIKKKKIDYKNKLLVSTCQGTFRYKLMGKMYKLLDTGLIKNSSLYYDYSVNFDLLIIIIILV